MVNYKTIYTLPFKSRKGVDYLIDIQNENYDGESFELTGSGESPFSVEIESEDFLYTPIRFSTATIRVVGDDYLRQLYSTAYQQYRVTFKRNGVVAWCGFIKPEVYSQDYSSGCFELEIECASAMSVLEYVNYKQLNTESKTFVSLWSLIKECISLSRGQYSGVYLPHVYAKDATDYANGANVLAEMTVSEQNFFDEDDKPMKLKEVLEEICKLLNWTCADYLGALYFVDVDYTGEYYRYTPGFESYTMEAIGGVQIVQRIGFSGSEHTLDFLSGYNKCTVKTSNYPVGEVIPEETFDAIVIRGGNGQMIPAPRPVTPGGRGENIIQVVQTPTVYELHGYEVDSSVGSSGTRKKYLGAKLYRNCIYSVERQEDGSYKPTIKEYSYDDCVCAIVKAAIYTDRDRYDMISIKQGTKILSFANNLPCAAYYAGAFCISASAAQSKDELLYVYSPNVGSTSPLKLICKLEISGNYWDGSKWTSAESTFSIPVNPERTGYTSVVDTKELGMPYSGVSGYLIELPNKPLVGGLKFEMLTPECGNDVTAVYLKDFSIVYKKADGEKKDDDNSDRNYENVINEDYINELDEIEFKISSYNNDGACYSKVLLGNDYLTNNLYSAVMGKQIRPEEQLIHRIVNRYSATNIKLTQVIRESPDLTPITRLSDKYMGDKVFISTGGLIDYSMDSFQCVMIQL